MINAPTKETKECDIQMKPVGEMKEIVRYRVKSFQGEDASRDAILLKTAVKEAQSLWGLCHCDQGWRG